MIREITKQDSIVIERLYNVPVGAGGTTDNIEFGIAGEDIGRFRVVGRGSDDKLYKVSYDSTEIFNVVGLTRTAGMQDGSITYSSYGEIEDTFFGSFNDGLVFLGSDGELTQTVMDVGWLLIVGSIVAPDTLKVAINIATAIKRG